MSDRWEVANAVNASAIDIAYQLLQAARRAGAGGVWKWESPTIRVQVSPRKGAGYVACFFRPVVEDDLR